MSIERAATPPKAADDDAALRYHIASLRKDETFWQAFPEHQHYATGWNEAIGAVLRELVERTPEGQV